MLLENAGINGSYQMLSDSGRSVMLYTESAESGSDLYIREYNAETDAWSEGIRLTYQELGYINDYSAFINEDGEIVVVYTSELDEAADMYVTEAVPREDITVNSVYYDANTAVPGNTVEVYLDITNHGAQDIDKLRIALEKDGSTVSESVITTSLAAGETTVLTVPVQTPESGEYGEYRIVVSAPEHEEFDDSDNNAVLVFGETDLALDYEAFFGNDVRILDITVENRSGYASGAALTVRRDNAEGEVLDIITIDSVDAKSVEAIRYIADDTPGTLYLEVTADAEETRLYDNSVSYLIREPEISIVYGDVDGDGEVTTADADLLSRYFAGHDVTLPVPEAADVNGDEVVNRKDAMILSRHIAGWEGFTLPYSDS